MVSPLIEENREIWCPDISRAVLDLCEVLCILIKLYKAISFDLNGQAHVLKSLIQSHVYNMEHFSMYLKLFSLTNYYAQWPYQPLIEFVMLLSNS